VDIAALLLGVALHIGDPPPEQKVDSYRWFTPGIGVLLRPQDEDRARPFLLGARYENSLGRTTYMLGAGVDVPITGHTGVLVGVAAATGYRPPSSRETMAEIPLPLASIYTGDSWWRVHAIFMPEAVAGAIEIRLE